MKAAVCTAYGPPEVVAIREVPTPAPKQGELLIRVHAATVSSGDARVRAANFPPGFALPARLALGWSGPRRPVLGTELSGTVEAVGAGVTRFRPGDVVFAAPGMAMGGHAEGIVLPADGPVMPIPPGFDFDEAASIAFGGGTALHFLTGPGGLRQGERVLVNGASGAVGSAAVQIARHLGAHVTAVCSARNADLARSLGAHSVVDYAAADFAATGESWDVILDSVGDCSLRRCRKALREGGRLLLLVADLGQMLTAPVWSRVGGIRVAAGPAPDSLALLARLHAICEAGGFRPLIDSRFALDGIVEAHRRVDSRRKRGSVVVTMR